jgi:hypothetical protein
MRGLLAGVAAGAGVLGRPAATWKEPRLSEFEKVSPVPFAVFCGLDVGKSEHHARALDTAGRRVHDKALPNDRIRPGHAADPPIGRLPRVLFGAA